VAVGRGRACPKFARAFAITQPELRFVDGLHQMIDWYFENHDADEVRRTLDGGGLIDRRVEPIGGAR